MHIATTAPLVASELPPGMAEAMLAEAVAEPAPASSTLSALVETYRSLSAEEDRLSAIHNAAEALAKSIDRPGAPLPGVLIQWVAGGTLQLDGQAAVRVGRSSHTYLRTSDIDASGLPAELKAQMRSALADFNAAVDKADAECGWSAARRAAEEAEGAWEEAGAHTYAAFCAIRDDFEPATLEEAAAMASFLLEVAEDAMADVDARPILRGIVRLACAGDEHLLSLASELERCMVQERADNAGGTSDEEAEDHAVQTGRVCQAIMSIPARSIAGLTLQARAISACFNSDGKVTEFDRHGTADIFANELFERLIAGTPPSAVVSPGAMTFAQEQAETTAMYDAVGEGPDWGDGQRAIWNRFEAAPIFCPADAAEKLRFVLYGLENGETAYDKPIVEQVIAYLTSGAPVQPQPVAS